MHEGGADRPCYLTYPPSYFRGRPFVKSIQKTSFDNFVRFFFSSSMCIPIPKRCSQYLGRLRTVWLRTSARLHITRLCSGRLKAACISKWKAFQKRRISRRVHSTVPPYVRRAEPEQPHKQATVACHETSSPRTRAHRPDPLSRT